MTIGQWDWFSTKPMAHGFQAGAWTAATPVFFYLGLMAALPVIFLGVLVGLLEILKIKARAGMNVAVSDETKGVAIGSAILQVAQRYNLRKVFTYPFDRVARLRKSADTRLNYPAIAGLVVGVGAFLVGWSSAMTALLVLFAIPIGGVVGGLVHFGFFIFSARKTRVSYDQWSSPMPQ
jgi:hypothetical protein